MRANRQTQTLRHRHEEYFISLPGRSNYHIILCDNSRKLHLFSLSAGYRQHSRATVSTCKFIYLLQIHFAKRCSMFHIRTPQRRNTAPISSNKTADTVGQSIYYLPYTKGSRCITCQCLHITSLFLSAAGLYRVMYHCTSNSTKYINKWLK